MVIPKFPATAVCVNCSSCVPATENPSPQKKHLIVDFRLPTRITVDDLRALALLMAIAQGEQLPFDGFSAKLVKSEEYEDAVSSASGQKFQVIARFPRINPPPVVFGTAVDTGPISLHAAEAKIDNPKDFLDRYGNAKYGEGVPVRFSLEQVHAQLGADSTPHVYIKPVEGSATGNGFETG